MKQEVRLKKLYRRPIGAKKLSILTELCLRHRGKMDCREQVLRKGADGIFMSPFMKQEVSRYAMRIQRELEMQEKILLTIKSEIENEQLKLEQKQCIAKGIDLTDVSSGKSTSIRLRGEETLSDDVIEFYRMSEINARLLVKKKQKETLDMSINTISNKKQQYELMIEKESTVTSLRCKQLYEQLNMRLSAYWAGVLKDINHSQDIPPIFTIDNLVKEIKLGEEK